MVSPPLSPHFASGSLSNCDKIFKERERKREYKIFVIPRGIRYKASRSNGLLYEPREGTRAIRFKRLYFLFVSPKVKQGQYARSKIFGITCNDPSVNNHHIKYKTSHSTQNICLQTVNWFAILLNGSTKC